MNHGKTHSVLLLAVGVTLGLPIASVQAKESKTSSWQVKVDFTQPIKDMDPAYASANVNRPGVMVRDEAYDQAVRSLGFRMMRFQGPMENKRGYKEPLTEEELQTLDAAVDKARNQWGVKDLMISVHRIHMPTNENGRLIPGHYATYAKRCVELVKRYAPPGNVRVRYWEPFNEKEAQKHIKRYKANGQSFADAVKWYVVCAKAMKAVNPEILIGGPAMCDAASKHLRTFLEGTKGLVDFVSWHDYATGNAGTPDDNLLHTVTGRGRFVGGARRLKNVMDSFQCGKLPMFLDEYHVNYRAWDPPEARTATQFSAVFAASVLANMSNSPVNRTFIHDVFISRYGLVGPASNERYGDSGALMDKSNSDAIHVRPVGWVYRWFNQYAGGQWVQCDVKMPKADESHHRGPLLVACAWRNGKHRVVMLVNQDRKSHNVTVTLGGKIPSDGYALPLRMMTVVKGRPCDMRTTGTKKGQITWMLPKMSVAFLVYEETSKEAGTP